MLADADIEPLLEAVTAALNESRLDRYDTALVQEVVTRSCGAELDLTVDAGGGLHVKSGARIGAIHRTPSGEWITDRQNPHADHADAPIPAATADN